MPRRSIRVNVSRIKPYIPPFKIEQRQTELPHIEINVHRNNRQNNPVFDQLPNVPPPPINADPPNNLPLLRPNAPPPVVNQNQVIAPENNGQNLAHPAVRNMAPQHEPEEFDDLTDFLAYRDSENYVEPETDIIPFENMPAKMLKASPKK